MAIFRAETGTERAPPTGPSKFCAVVMGYVNQNYNRKNACGSFKVVTSFGTAAYGR